MTMHGRSVLVLAASMLVAIATLSVPLAALAVSFQGPAFPAGVTAPTGEKPESKLWFNDGSWWASMITTASGTYHIFRLDGQTWTDTGVQIDERTGSKADVLWDEGTGKLYVASHVFSTTSPPPAGQGRLYRFSYSAGTYTLDAGFPVLINSLSTETLVIDRDSTGKLWATWMQSGQVMVNRTTTDDLTWGTPFAIPGTQAANPDDISTIIAFTDSGGSKIGVAWTDQVDDAVYFAVHQDGDADTTWQTPEVAASGALIADDHINMKTDSSGRVYVVAKTGRDPDVSGATADLIDLFVRSAAGTWTTHVVRLAGVIGDPAGDHTRPVLLVDETNNLLRVYSNATGGGPVYEKTSSRTSIDFSPAAAGTIVINVAAINNVTSTKQNVDATTDILVIASAVAAGGTYWNYFQDLAGGPLPTVTIEATDNTATENPSTPGVFTVSRTGSTGAALTVSYTVSGSASNGTDYTLLSGSVVIPSGSGSATITVSPLDDPSAEGNETVIVTLSAAATYTVGSPSTATVTIQDDEPTVTIAATDNTATENPSTTGVFTVTRTGSTSAALTVFYTLNGSTATADSDYTALSGAVTIPASSATATITVTPLDDELAEGNETVVVTLTADSAYTVGASNSATVTIQDDEPTVTIVATDATASEPGTDTGLFTVTRVGNTSSALTVNYTVGGTATAGGGADYETLSDSVVIPAGQPSATITVTPIDNALVEPNETVVVTLNAAATYTVGAPSNATVTISDDEPTITLAVTDGSASEAGSDPGVFTVTRNMNFAAALTVHYTVGGTATAGGGDPDYVTLTGSVVIPAGVASATITVTPIDNALVEPSETVEVTLGAPPTPTYTVGAPNSGAVTISDDEPTITLAVTDGSASEPGTDTGVFTVTRSMNFAAALTVHYTVGGTATAGGGDPDYVTLTGSVVIPAGSATATITVTPIDNLLAEPDETVVVTLADAPTPTYTVGAPSNATVTILDDEPIVSIVATDDIAREPGADTGLFTVSRTGVLDADLTVNYTVGGTAQNGIDYAAIGTSVVIPAGSATATITLTAIGDADEEPNETVVVTLEAAPTYAVGDPNTATVTIINPATVTIVATDATAGEAGTNIGRFTISRTGVLDADLTVTYTVDGTATPGSDYVALSASPGSVIIPAGSATATITVTPIDDLLVEGSETVVLTINADPFYNVGVPNTATVAIGSNEVVATVTVTATDGQAREPGTNTGRFTVTRTGSTAAPLTVFYDVAGTATPGSDYVTLPGSVIIPAGAATATITVTALDDTHHEPNEAVVLTLSPLGVYNVGSPSSASVGIVSDDPRPTVTVTASDASASETGPDPGTFTVSRSGPTTVPLTVLYGVGGTASGSDYEALPGNVVIPAGSSSATITVTPIDDSLTEGNETVVATLAANAAYTVGAPGSATVTIGDNTNNAPDLVVSTVSNPPASRRRGGSFAVTDMVLNQGNGSAPSTSRVRYYLSADTVRDAGDRLLSGNHAVPALAVGAQVTRRATPVVPSNMALGIYFLLACADDTLLVIEGDEGNNCLASTTQITINP
jgi:hypothetical protein